MNNNPLLAFIAKTIRRIKYLGDDTGGAPIIIYIVAAVVTLLVRGLMIFGPAMEDKPINTTIFGFIFAWLWWSFKLGTFFTLLLYIGWEFRNLCQWLVKWANQSKHY